VKAQPSADMFEFFPNPTFGVYHITEVSYVHQVITFSSKHWDCLCSIVEDVEYSTPNSTSSITIEQVEDAKAVGCGIFHTLHCRTKAGP